MMIRLPRDDHVKPTKVLTSPPEHHLLVKWTCTKNSHHLLAEADDERRVED
jgi:hypothetical protein